jgi:hypothetical protein
MTTLRPVVPRPSDLRRLLHEAQRILLRSLPGRIRIGRDLVSRDLATLIGAVLAASTGIAVLLLLCLLVLAGVAVPALQEALGTLATDL